ncbi:MAG: DoxX family protein, partial [Candidatus Acidiferrales bacterium]
MNYRALRLWLDRAQPFGLLFLRLGIGLMFVLVHGWPKISGGVQIWERLGLNVGLTVVPAFWGFLAAASEFIGGLCLITGFLFRPACALLAATM